MACCLVRPDGIASLEAASVKKRLKDKRFAATVDRAEVAAGAERLGVSLDDHLGFVIDAPRAHAAELGLLGRAHPRGEGGDRHYEYAEHLVRMAKGRALAKLKAP